MIKEFLEARKELVFVEVHHQMEKKFPFRMMMEQAPELSLGPSISTTTLGGTSRNSSSLESDAYLCRKGKHAWEESMGTQTGIELQLNDPLPVDWEQCLDLQSGRMYYLNRRTLKRSWERPKEEQKLDLELNISTLPSSADWRAPSSANQDQYYPKKYTSSSGSMVAVACLNCHLLVMLSKSSPSCPNCKYVHSLSQPPQPRKIEAVKSLETLSLLH